MPNDYSGNAALPQRQGHDQTSNTSADNGYR